MAKPYQKAGKFYLRKGELLGLQKADVDLKGLRITVRRSYDHSRSKSGDDGVVPIAAALVPYLVAGMEGSRSKLVFPGSDGVSMMREDVKLEAVLRRALARGGIVEAYRHVCRRRGCGHVERHGDRELRVCPNGHMKLWPVPVHRPIRFHDLRHTTASLLIMAGADMAAVQRILRHSDPRMTMGTYAHLAPNYLRDQIDRLAFPPQVAPTQGLQMRDAASVSRSLPTSALDALAAFDDSGN